MEAMTAPKLQTPKAPGSGNVLQGRSDKFQTVRRNRLEKSSAVAQFGRATECFNDVVFFFACHFCHCLLVYFMVMIDYLENLAQISAGESQSPAQLFPDRGVLFMPVETWLTACRLRPKRFRYRLLADTGFSSRALSFRWMGLALHGFNLNSGC